MSAHPGGVGGAINDIVMEDSDRAHAIDFMAPGILVPHPRNPNQHSDAQIERLCKLITYQGFRVPIIMSSLSGYVVAGHGRLLAAKRLGMTRVPVICQHFDHAEQEYAFMVSDNAISEWAELDFAGINEVVPDLGPDFNIDLLGIAKWEVDAADKDVKGDKCVGCGRKMPKGRRA